MKKINTVVAPVESLEDVKPESLASRLLSTNNLEQSKATRKMLELLCNETNFLV